MTPHLVKMGVAISLPASLAKSSLVAALGQVLEQARLRKPSRSMGPKRCRTLAGVALPSAQSRVATRTRLVTNVGPSLPIVRARRLAPASSRWNAGRAKLKRKRKIVEEEKAHVDLQGWVGEMSDATSSGSSESAPMVGGNERTRIVAARRRARLRLRRYLDEAVNQKAAGRSFLETRAVSVPSRRTYEKALDDWRSYLEKVGLQPRSAAETDGAVADYFDEGFFQGRQPSTGERLLAALMDREPRFGRYGGDRLPRSWRALKGWRRMIPPRSRKPLPWPVWSALAWRLKDAGRLDMMLFTLMCVTGYFRPSELLRLRRGDLVPPAKHVLKSWSVLIAPEEEKVPTKTQNFNDSVLMDSALLDWMGPFYEKIHASDSTELVWDFTYSQYVVAFRRAVAELRLKDVVPYQMRHSGPSIDLANGARTMEEAQTRGRWAVSSTMARYERRSRLSKEWSVLTQAQRSLFTDCAEALEDIATNARHCCRLGRL